MNKLEFMQAVLETAKMIKDMTPETIAADAQAIADGIKLTQEESKNRDDYNDLVRSTNEAVAQLKLDQKALSDGQAQLQRDTTKLENDLKALDTAQGKLRDDQKQLGLDQQKVVDDNAALDQRRTDADARDTAQNERDTKQDEREAALKASEEKTNAALKIMQS